MTKLTQKGIKFDWGEKEENAFQLIKQKFCSASILALLEGSKDFVVYCDAAHKGLDRIVTRHGTSVSIICDRDGRFTSNFKKSFQKALEMIQETTEKIILIKQRIQAAQDQKKSYADRKRKTMEFEVGDRVMLKKCYANEPLVMPLKGAHIEETLQFVKEPVEIMEREIKRLKRSRIPLVKVYWNSRRGPEFT
nr:hypothetical protein [Tanacetum cinerariifolium]